MDTSSQPHAGTTAPSTALSQTKQRRSVEQRRKIVEETLAAGASMARVARAHGVNANQVFHWRKLYREGRLGNGSGSAIRPAAGLGGGVIERDAWNPVRGLLSCLARHDSHPPSSWAHSH
jgi:Transposase